MSTRLTNLLYMLVLTVLFATNANSEPAGKPLRVGGDYQVNSIERVGDNEFCVEFKATTPSGKFDVLKLHSNHVHVAVRIGQKLRLSAEVLNVKGASAEVAQMVIFVPNPQGPVPIWLLSSRTGPRDLNATKYLEMHSPLTDYVIL